MVSLDGIVLQILGAGGWEKKGRWHDDLPFLLRGNNSIIFLERNWES